MGRNSNILPLEPPEPSPLSCGEGPGERAKPRKGLGDRRWQPRKERAPQENQSLWIIKNLLIVTILLLTPTLKAQKTPLTNLANQLCNCLTNSNQPPSQSADTCLATLMTDNAEMLENRYAITPGVLRYRYLLLDRLVPALADNCPILSTLPLLTDEREFRWSDQQSGRVTPSPDLYRSPKAVPKDRTPKVAESPTRRRLAGQLIRKTNDNKISIKLPDGGRRVFTMAKNLKRVAALRPGDQVAITYRREWRVNEGTIVDVVTRIVPTNPK